MANNYTQFIKTMNNTILISCDIVALYLRTQTGERVLGAVKINAQKFTPITFDYLEERIENEEQKEYSPLEQTAVVGGALIGLSASFISYGIVPPSFLTLGIYKSLYDNYKNV